MAFELTHKTCYILRFWISLTNRNDFNPLSLKKNLLLFGSDWAIMESLWSNFLQQIYISNIFNITNSHLKDISKYVSYRIVFVLHHINSRWQSSKVIYFHYQYPKRMTKKITRWVTNIYPAVCAGIKKSWLHFHSVICYIYQLELELKHLRQLIVYTLFKLSL